MRKLAWIIFLLIWGSAFVWGQSDTISQKYITVHFLYGSKPAKGFKKTETKSFGGIHGGHVFMQIDTMMFSFIPKTGWHIVAKRHHIKGGYVLEPESVWEKDTVGNKYTSIRIPISDSQYVILKNLENNFLTQSPYDYAFFGMRCAAAAADVLSQIGIVKKRSNLGDICKDFYPKRLRKKLLRYAHKHKLEVITKNGRASKRWEKD